VIALIFVVYVEQLYYDVKIQRSHISAKEHFRAVPAHCKRLFSVLAYNAGLFVCVLLDKFKRLKFILK